MKVSLEEEEATSEVVVMAFRTSDEFKVVKYKY